MGSEPPDMHISIQNPDTERPGRLRGVTIGVVSALFALGVSEMVAGISTSMQSPILDVGDRVIDLVPSSVKEFAINVFGTNDKLALLVGIGVILFIYSAVVGWVATRGRPILGVLGIGLFGAVGAIAAVTNGGGLIGAVPSVVGVIAGIAVLLFLVKPASLGLDTTSSADGSRRRFLTVSAAFAVSAGVLAVVGRVLDQAFDVSGEVAAARIPEPAEPLPPVPENVSLDVEGLTPFTTPNADFYRIDTALTVPQLSTDSFRLRVFGMVEREMELTWDDLISRQIIESDITLTCVSNEIGGQLIGNARWRGIPLKDLLDEAGIVDGADQIVGRSIDGFACGFPVAALDGRDAMVAIGMNGDPLPLEHGYPARLVVPGLYGYVSATKWLTEIELTTFAEFDHYWVSRGWSVEGPIKTQSRIDTPPALTPLPPGMTAIAGVAWAQTRGIERVEVRVDDGEWQETMLAEALNDTTWRQWMLPWDATPGRHDITVRATDGTGETQPEERTPPIPDGAAGWHSIVVMVDEV